MNPMPPHNLRIYYGGTFDPVHEGHLAIARAARDELGAPVHLMPAADPPHRAVPGADARQRVAMLQLAVEGEEGLQVDERELHRPGPSYSVETLRRLRSEFGSRAPLALLLGADSFLGLPTWYQWRSLPELAHLIVAERPGSPLDGGLPDELAEEAEGRWRTDPTALSETPAGCLFRLRQPWHMESATNVREAIARGSGSWRGWVPAAVAGYITRHGLYRRTSSTPSSATPDDIEH